jgi:cytochrome c553
MFHEYRRLGAGCLPGLLLWASLICAPAEAQEFRRDELVEQALRVTPDISAGKKLFAQQCARCHGKEAYGNANDVVPSLASQLPIYLIKQFVDMAEGERASTDMHRIAARKSLTAPQAIGDLARYLGSLDPNPKPEVGDGTQLAMGKRHYQGLCAFCHGAQGGGNEAHATPALRRQHYSYLLMQMRELSADHRYSVSPEIVEMLQQLTYDQFAAIADYASRLPMVDSTHD